MKRSNLTSFIRESIIETLSEADVDIPLAKITTQKANAKITNARGFAQFILKTWNDISDEENDSVTALQDLKIAKAKLEKVAKAGDLSIKEANIGLDDLQDIGYDDGEYAFDMHFNKSQLNNRLDTKYYTRGFVQAITDSAESLRLNENATPRGEDFTYDYEDIGQFYLEGFGKEHTLNQDQLGMLGKKITDNLYGGDIGKAYDAVVNPHKNPYDIKEDEDDDLDAKAIKQAKGARGKHKKLDIALKSLKSITAEMKSLAREYSKADGVEKEKIKDKLKKKTPIKKELEAMVAKLEKNVV